MHYDIVPVTNTIILHVRASGGVGNVRTACPSVVPERPIPGHELPTCGRGCPTSDKSREKSDIRHKFDISKVCVLVRSRLHHRNASASIGIQNFHFFAAQTAGTLSKSAIHENNGGFGRPCSSSNSEKNRDSIENRPDKSAETEEFHRNLFSDLAATDCGIL